MRGEHTQQFFVLDAEQLLAIQTLVIHTTPLHLKYDGRLGGKLDADIVLPMIKLYDRVDRLPLSRRIADVAELEKRLVRNAGEAAVVHVLGTRGWFDAARWDAFDVRRERIATGARAARRSAAHPARGRVAGL
ncbi:hypothetical protein [Accumulibacter sp.]|nr:hypothetical protein [Accumulibacter sp.]MCM8627067.1 hypothetical protein [Accumulibacter sp.]